MNNTRTGKIARLPQPVRDELNRRLEQNIPGRIILPWLNSLPEVQALLEDSFDSEPVNQQNLSNWRRGGFLEWQTREHLLSSFRELAADAADIEAALGSLTDHAARLLALHFSLVLCPPKVVHGSNANTPAAPAPALSGAKIKGLCQITRAISALRRDDIAAARLKLQQQAEDTRTTHAASASAASTASTNTIAPEPLPLSPPPEPAIKVDQANSSLYLSLPSLCESPGFLSAPGNKTTLPFLPKSPASLHPAVRNTA